MSAKGHSAPGLVTVLAVTSGAVMVPSWLKFCARGLFCSLKEIRRIKGTFAENWHFLLEVVRTDGRALAVESRCFLFKALPSALLPSTCLPLSPRPPQGARATLESGPWCASWQGRGSWKSCPSCTPHSSSSRDSPETRERQGGGKRPGPHAVPRILP